MSRNWSRPISGLEETRNVVALDVAMQPLERLGSTEVVLPLQQSATVGCLCFLKTHFQLNHSNHSTPLRAVESVWMKQTRIFPYNIFSNFLAAPKNAKKTRFLVAGFCSPRLFFADSMVRELRKVQSEVLEATKQAEDPLTDLTASATASAVLRVPCLGGF